MRISDWSSDVCSSDLHSMHTPINEQALAQLFADARTHNGWQPREVSDAQLQAIYEAMKWAPTSANCSPARIVFIKSADAKQQLAPAQAEGNLAKTQIGRAHV